MWKKLHTMGLNIFWRTAYLAVSLLFTTAVDDTTDSKKFVGDDIRSQFGELFKPALQIWRAFQIWLP